VTGLPIDAGLSIRGGHLWLEQCDLVDVAERYGTPLYVISEDQLLRNLELIGSAFRSAWPHGEVRVLPSIKANLSLAVRRTLTRAGAGCDTFGPGELHAALLAGVPPDLISVNGSIKSAEVIDRAVAADARITLDSAPELAAVEAAAKRQNTRARIRLRLRPDYDGLSTRSDFFPDVDVRLAAHRYKPGIPTEQAAAVGAAALASAHVELTGVMAHLGRHSADLDVWRGMATSFAELITRLSGEWNGWRPQEIDIGGGFPAPHDPTSPTGADAAPIAEYAQAVAGTLAAALAKGGLDPAGIALEVEPGRSLHADAGLHLATVRGLKRQHAPIPWAWVETDTTEMFLADLLIEHAHFRPVVASRADAPAVNTTDIVGMSCGFDVLAQQIEFPEVEVNDVIAFLDTGAYQDACANNWNALPRPGTVLVHGAEAEWIKRPETVDEVFARDLVPERLR
jgi:diaminopimelate decarboxylase